MPRVAGFLYCLKAIAPLAISAAFAAAGHIAVGESLGLFLSGLIAVSILVPTLTATEGDLLSITIIDGSILLPILISWAILVLDHAILLSEWSLCAAVILSYAILLSGAIRLLCTMRISKVASAAVVVFLALAWLSWPIWLSPWLSGSGGEHWAARLIRCHPLFAVNATLMRPFAVPWGEYRIAYASLTNLGQDIPYEMPATVWPCALGHLFVGLVLFGLTYLSRLSAKNESRVEPLAAKAI